MTQEQFFNRYKYDRTKDRIGGGGFGNVYKVFDTIENETVALKIAEVKQGQESLSLLKEVELASSLERHVNIARYTSCHRFDLPNGHFDFGILQYYPLGNLSQLVKSQMLNYVEKEQIAHGIISGLQHLHSNNIVHRDLKSANILIAGGYQGEFVPKIADFGLSKQFTQNENSYFSNSFAGGSLLYVAPEQLEGKELRKNADLWSLGVVLFELFIGDTPFRANVDDGSETARAEIISKIRNSCIPSSISNIPSPWHDVIKICLVTNPSNRIKRIEDVQDIVNGKTSVRKVIDGTEVDTGLGVESKELETSQIKEKRNDSIKENNIKYKSISERSKLSSLYYLFGLIILIVVLIMFIKSCGGITTQEALAEISSNMVQVPKGSFIMGCTSDQGSDCDVNEKPAHKVTVSSFKINKYEVTQEQWRAIMGNNLSHFKNCNRCPAEQISWNDAQEFIKKLNSLSGRNYRLPTEAEWEYGARGSQSYKYAGSNDIGQSAWYNENSGGETHPVGKKAPNGFGLYDMSGNVWEWCSDLYKEYSGVESDWTGSGRVIRGGSYHQKARNCRVSIRTFDNEPGDSLGFRLVESQ